MVWGFFSFKIDNGSSVLSGLLNTEKDPAYLPLGEGQTVEDLNFSSKEYKHSILGFSFIYPKEYSISSFGNFFDLSGETILLQNKENSSGLQVLVTPFDEDIALTLKRIKKDLPSLSVLDGMEQEIGAADVKVQAVVFKSDNNLTTGKSIEAWFVYRKNLYQISSPDMSVGLFQDIIKTWKLEE